MTMTAFHRATAIAVSVLLLSGGVGILAAPARGGVPRRCRPDLLPERPGRQPAPVLHEPRRFPSRPPHDDGREHQSGALTRRHRHRVHPRRRRLDDGHRRHRSSAGRPATPAAEATPVWSPDTTRIAYAVRADGGTDVEIMFRAADGTGGATQMTDNAFPDTDPAWSPPLPGWPDGLIAFESARTGDTDRNIYVMDSGGGAVANADPSARLPRCPVPGSRRRTFVEPGREDRLHAHLSAERRWAAGHLDRGR